MGRYAKVNKQTGEISEIVEADEKPTLGDEEAEHFDLAEVGPNATVGMHRTDANNGETTREMPPADKTTSA